MSLQIDDIVDITVNLSPAGVVRPKFDSGLIITANTVIPTTERIRQYSNINGVITDFGTLSVEYNCASLYFSQNPKPTKLFIGVKGTTETYLEAVTECREANGQWYSVFIPSLTSSEINSIAGFIESVKPFSTFFYGVPFEIPNFTVNYTGTETYEMEQTNGVITLTFDPIPETDPVASEFTLSYAGNPIAFTFAYSDTLGIATLTFTPVTPPFDLTVLDTLKSANYRRSQGIVSNNANASAGVMGLALGRNTQTNNSAYTLAYKTITGLTTQPVTETQYNNIISKNGNVYVDRGQFKVYQPGKQADGNGFDEVINLDILVNNIQLAVMGLLNSVSKVPQTDQGVGNIISVILPELNRAVNTGFIASGIWNAPPILNLNTGDTLPNGYYVEAETVDSQPQQEREERIAPPIYICIKLAGAIEYVKISLNVNR